MAFARVYSAQHSLLQASIITVETDISRGLFSFSIVGLADKAVDEAKDRVHAAIKNTGLESPKSKNHKVVISLAPANIKKEGALFDVAVALSYLKASGAIDFDADNILFLGELGLDGSVRPVRGILPLVQEAKRRGFQSVCVPKDNTAEAALIHGIDIYGITSLAEAIAHVEGKTLLAPEMPTEISHGQKEEAYVDFADVRGQETAKRGLEIAASGGHNIAMYGPPGTGKTMLAKAFAHILPPLERDHILEATAIHSFIEDIREEHIVTYPPFRAPHHTASYVSIIGGGSHPKPGEVTLAHRGVLFLDEFPEFDRRVIESLREPLENRIVHISRAKGSAKFPAHFILIAAMNPCPCGFHGVSGKECVCSPIAIANYRRKISGPIMDRIDMWIEVSRIDHEKLGSGQTGETTGTIRKRVLESRNIQKERFTGTPIRTNSDMQVKELDAFATLGADVRNLLDTSAKALDLSSRAYHRIIRVARTIADMEHSSDIMSQHILEALQYRPKNFLQ